MATNTVLNIIVNGEDNASRALSSVGGGMDRLKGISGAVSGALTVGAGAAITKLGLDAVSAASDLDESMNKVNVVFGDNAAAIATWASGASTNLGQSQQGALEAVGTFGNLFSAMGIGQDASADMSMGLVQLASDLGSFNNMDPTQVLEKLRSGLVGETEPLRTLGVNLTAAGVEARAMAMGLAATKEELTPAMLAQARFADILDQTTLAQGDFSRTSDGLANSQRTLTSQISDLSANLGTLLLPLAQDLIGWISQAVGWFSSLDPKVQGIILGVAGLAAVAAPLLPIIGVLGTVIGALASPIGIVVAAIALLAAAWATDFGGIRSTVTEFWNTHLKGIFETLVRWLQENIPAALETLAGFWENTLKPAIETVWGFLVEHVFPIFQDLVEIYMKAVKVELEFLAGVWETVLKPAIEKVWAFLVEHVFPILSDLVDIYIANAKEALRVLAWFWEEKLKPAIDTVWRLIVEDLIPGLVDLKAKIEGVVRRALETAKRLFDDISGAVNAVKDAVAGVIEWFNRMKEAISNWSPPAWVSSLGGAIAGIVDGLGHAPEAIGEFRNSLASLEPASDAIAKIATALKALVDAFSAVAGYDTGAKLGPALQRLLDQLGAVIRKLERAAAEFSTTGLAAAVQLAEAMGKIGKGLKDAVDGLAAVANHVEVKIGPALQRIIDQYGAVIRKLVRAAAAFNEQGLAAAVQLAEAMGKIGKQLGDAVKGLAAVALYSASRQIDLAVERLVSDWARLVAALQTASLKLSDEGLAAAIRLAEAMGKIGKQMGDAVEGLLAIATYTQRRNFPTRLRAFAEDLAAAAHQLSRAIMTLGSEILADIEAAAAYAEPIRALASIVQDGLAALAALAVYARRRDIQGAVWRFANDLVDLAEALATALLHSRLLAVRGLPAAVALAQQIQSIVGVVSPALAAIQAITGYTAAANLAAATQAFAADMLIMANALVEALGNPSAAMLEAYAQATVLATAIGGVIAIIQPAMDALQALSRYGGREATALHAGMEKLTRNLEGLINFLASHYQVLGSGTVAQAREFAEAILAIVTAVRDSLAAAAGIEGTQATYAGGFGVGSSWLQGVVDGMASGMGNLQGAMAGVNGLLGGAPGSAYRGGAYGAWGGGGGDVTVNVTMSGPFNVRSDADLERIVALVSESIARQAGMTRRLGLQRA